MGVQQGLWGGVGFHRGCIEFDGVLWCSGLVYRLR